MKVIEKYLDTKNKKIAAGVTAAVIIAAVGGGTYWALRDTAPELLLKNSKTITIEYGEKYEPKFENLVKTNGLDKEDVHTLQHNTKITSDLKNEKVEIKDEAGNVTGVEEKEYPAVGKYTIELKYYGDTFKQKVEVKDTTAPEITAPENIEILQGTDLNTFDFKSLLPVTDFSEISDYTFDLSGIDANVPGEYTLKVSIQDKYENKTEKDVKVTVTAPPAVASDEVVVQEEVTNPDGTKSIKNTVKKKTDAGGNKVVSTVLDRQAEQVLLIRQEQQEGTAERLEETQAVVISLQVEDQPEETAVVQAQVVRHQAEILEDQRAEAQVVEVMRKSRLNLLR